MRDPWTDRLKFRLVCYERTYGRTHSHEDMGVHSCEDICRAKIKYVLVDFCQN